MKDPEYHIRLKFFYYNILEVFACDWLSSTYIGKMTNHIQIIIF